MLRLEHIFNSEAYHGNKRKRMILYICSNQSIHKREGKSMETSEKVSVNMNIATLSQIDLLVDKGYYSNRSDFINQSVRQALNEKKSVIEETSKQQKDLDFWWFIGVMGLEREDLLKAKEKKKKIKIKGYGLLCIDGELDDIVIENVESVAVKGKVLCSDRIKKHFDIR